MTAYTARDIVAGAQATHAIAERTEQVSRRQFSGGVLPSCRKFVEAMRTLYIKNGVFDFAAFGRDTAHLSLDIPRARIMLGPLGVPPKAPRAQPAKEASKRQTREEMIAAGGVAVRPPDVTDVAAATDTTTDRRATELWSHIETIRRRQGIDVVCLDGVTRLMVPLIQTLFDPYSYSQVRIVMGKRVTVLLF